MFTGMDDGPFDDILDDDMFDDDDGFGMAMLPSMFYSYISFYKSTIKKSLDSIKSTMFIVW